MERKIDNYEEIWKIFNELYVSSKAFYSSNDLYNYFLKRNVRDIDYDNDDSIRDEYMQKLLLGKNHLQDDGVIRDADWNYCISRQFSGEKRHRLYIPANNDDTMKLVFEFIRKSVLSNNQFYLKYHFDRDKLDRLIIYPTDEQLPKCIEILREIAQKYPDVISNMPDVPMTTMPIDNWIGYAVEDNSKKTGSYNRKIADSILNGFRSTILFNKGLIDLSQIDINRFIECYALSLGRNDGAKNTAVSQFTSCVSDSNVRKQLIEKIKTTHITLDDLENNRVMFSIDYGGVNGWFKITASTIIDYMKSQYKEIVNAIGEDEFKRQLFASVDHCMKEKGVDKESVQERLTQVLGTSINQQINTGSISQRNINQNTQQTNISQQERIAPISMQSKTSNKDKHKEQRERLMREYQMQQDNNAYLYATSVQEREKELSKLKQMREQMLSLKDQYTNGFKQNTNNTNGTNNVQSQNNGISR